MKIGGYTWTPSKTKLLRTIGNANAIGRVFRLNDFTRRDAEWFVALGLCTLTERGPVLTELGQAKYRALPDPKDRRGWRVTIERRA